MTTRKYPDLINELAIIQGETYRELSNGLITVAGDWSAGTPRGQIRNNLFELGGELLTEFEFDVSVYDVDTDRTTINPFLRDVITANLPATTWKEGRTLSARNAYLYDIEIELAGDVVKLAYGFVQVIGEVTVDDNTPPIVIPPPIYLKAENNLSEVEDVAEAVTNLGLDDVLRDGDRPDFATASHTQPASTITDFQATVSSNSDVAANTTARHSAVTVTDSSTIDFTLSGQNITGIVKDGSVATAQLSAGVNASLGRADSAVQPAGLIPYAPLLNPLFTGNNFRAPNNFKINGVEHFYQTTKPTVRGDSSALVVGDRWYKTEDYTEWRWNGTYWLSPVMYSNMSNSQAYSASLSQVAISYFPILYSATFLEGIILQFRQTTGTIDSSNFYTFSINQRDNDGAGGTLYATYILNNSTLNVQQEITILVNSVFTDSHSPSVGIYATPTITGSPGGVRYSLIAKYRYIHP